jgi:hypothetical protein
MAQARAAAMPGGMTAANITAANTAVGASFGVSDLLRTTPMDSTTAGSGATASVDQRSYGMTLAAISQEAMGLGMTSSSGMVTALVEDSADGVMNGKMGSTAITMAGMPGGMMGGGGTMMASSAGTAGLATAMTAFIGSAMNRSGEPLAGLQPLIDKLSASTGVIPAGP